MYYIKTILFTIPLLLAAASTDPVRRLEEKFLAPCCWSESVAFHRSPKAETMRAEIRTLVGSGKSEAEIVNIFVAQYGERILREPRGGLGVWLIVIPVVMLMLGGLGLVAYLRRARRTARQFKPVPASGPLPDIEDEW